MRGLYLYLFISIYFSMTMTSQNWEVNKTEYDLVLTNLKNNYTLLLEKQLMEKEYYYESFDITEKKHKELYKLYIKSTKDLLDLDKGLLKYLLLYKDSKRVNRDSWVQTVNPLRSDVYSFYTKPEEALILIDYYLVGRDEQIKAPDYLDKISFRKIKKFLKKNNTLTKGELRNQYKGV